MKIREPTLPFDAGTMSRNLGFTSPLGARLRLYWLGLTARARAFSYEDSQLRAKGWEHNGVWYVTRVRARSVTRSPNEAR